eukprot:403332698
MSYDFDDSLGSKDIMLNITLSLSNYDITQWGNNVNGQYGMYMGIGLGSSTMQNSDLILCTYVYRNRSDDKFNCYDQYTNNDRTRFNDTSNDIVNTFTISPSVSPLKLGKTNFTVKFQRKFRTSEAFPRDFQLASKIENITYAYGAISGGSIQKCTANARGFKYFDLTRAPATAGQDFTQSFALNQIKVFGLFLFAIITTINNF